MRYALMAGSWILIALVAGAVGNMDVMTVWIICSSIFAAALGWRRPKGQVMIDPERGLASREDEYILHELSIICEPEWWKECVRNEDDVVHWSAYYNKCEEIAIERGLEIPCRHLTP